jgi:hypothetical protein
MKKYITTLTLLTVMFALGMLCYFYMIPRYILAPVFLITYFIITIKFLKPKQLRMNKLKFLSIPTLILTLCSIFFFQGTLFFTSLLGCYIMAVGIKNWLKMKLLKDNI